MQQVVISPASGDRLTKSTLPHSTVGGDESRLGLPHSYDLCVIQLQYVEEEEAAAEIRREKIPPLQSKIADEFRRLGFVDPAAAVGSSPRSVLGVQGNPLSTGYLKMSPPGSTGPIVNGSVELQDNILAGGFPDAEDSSASPDLGEISLSYNRLSGPLPPSNGNFSGVQKLLLNQNQFSGVIPPEIVRLRQVSKMDLSGNRFSGRISPEISECKLLTFVDLSRNDLTGDIPTEITGVRILNYLNLSRNRLDGEIPPSHVRRFLLQQSLWARPGHRPVQHPREYMHFQGTTKFFLKIRKSILCFMESRGTSLSIRPRGIVEDDSHVKATFLDNLPILAIRYGDMGFKIPLIRVINDTIKINLSCKKTWIAILKQPLQNFTRSYMANNPKLKLQASIILVDDRHKMPWIRTITKIRFYGTDVEINESQKNAHAGSGSKFGWPRVIEELDAGNKKSKDYTEKMI